MEKKTLKEKIVRAFASSMGDPEAAEEIAFHITDCETDFREISNLFSHPEQFSDRQVLSFIISFLAHVPNHLAAAKKLAGIGPIEDIFDEGVLVEDE
jgi:hypothetical protein